jgi:heme exporter protein D
MRPSDLLLVLPKSVFRRRATFDDARRRRKRRRRKKKKKSGLLIGLDIFRESF